MPFLFINWIPIAIKTQPDGNQNLKFNQANKKSTTPLRKSHTQKNPENRQNINYIKQ